MRFVLTVSVGVFLSACAEQSGVTRALSTDLPDRYARMAPVTPLSNEDAAWWLHFKDPVLDRLIAQGQTGNLTVAQARTRLKEAEANAHRARGLVLTGDGQLSATANDPGNNNKSLRLGAQINLAGADQKRTKAAIERLNASAFGVEEARRTILSEIAITYVNLRFQQQNLRSRKQDLASRRRTIADVEKQVDAGFATRLDQLRVRSLAAETRVDLPQIEAEILRQRNRLSTLLGVPVGALPIDLNYQGAQPLPRRSTAYGIPADLLRARPDIRQAEKLYAAALSDMDAAEADRYPSLSLSGALTAPLSGGSSSSTFLAGLILPIFNQPALGAEVDAAQARINRAYLQWRVAVLSALEEVETAQNDLAAALQAKSAAHEVVTMNQEALELSRRLLNSGGNITVLDVVDRERALSSARASVASSARDVAISYVSLRSALGVGHDFNTETAELN